MIVLDYMNVVLGIINLGLFAAFAVSDGEFTWLNLMAGVMCGYWVARPSVSGAS